MEITEVKIALRESPQTRLKAYATVTFDQCFVVRNIKIIEGKNGFFVAMPSRKPKVSCPRCRYKNDLGSRYCSQCGTAIPSTPTPTYGSGDGESQEAPAHRDIAHPITMEFRQYLQKIVLEAYEAERAKAPVAGAGEGEHETL